MNRFEGQIPIDQRLELEEAQEEANMMRVKLKEMVGHEPTVEDYDEALEVVEEMKLAADLEIDGVKVLAALLRVGNKYYTKGLDAFVRFVTGGRNLADKEWINERLGMFADARSELLKLKEQAKDFE